MNGSESLLNTLVDSGVNMCFANPGTSEMHFMAALDEVDGMQCVLALFEGVATGAADGYARMARKPAATLLHLGAGLSNGLANIHNAKKGHVPMVNIVGDHATYHLEYDAPLTSDIKGIALPVSHWFHSSEAPEEIGIDAAKAVEAAGHNKIATLVLPADVSWSDNPNGPAPAAQVAPLNRIADDRIQGAASLLKSGGKNMVLVGGGEVTTEMTLLLSQISEATGARICVETFPTRIGRGAGSGKIERLPYLAEMASEHIQDLDNLLMVGPKPPVSFFAYPNVPSSIPNEKTNVVQLALPEDDRAACIEDLLKAVGAQDVAPLKQERVTGDAPSGELTTMAVGQTIANRMPDNAIVVDEGATSSIPTYAMTENAAAHDWLTMTGGAIGWGLPCAVGAAKACPDRKVVCLEGDGSAMYTISALWTAAREKLDIIFVVYANRKYNILETEFVRTGARGGTPGPKAASTLDIGNPNMSFVEIAEGMGVPATQASTAEEFDQQFADAVSSAGPRLIEALTPPIDITKG